MLLQPVFHALLAAVQLLLCNTSLHITSIAHSFLGISPPQYLTLACGVAKPTVFAPAPKVTPAVDLNVSAFSSPSSPLSVVSVDTTPQSDDVVNVTLAPSTYSTDLVVYSHPVQARIPSTHITESIDAFAVARLPSPQGTDLVVLSSLLDSVSVTREDAPALTEVAPQHTTDIVIWTPAPTSPSGVVAQVTAPPHHTTDIVVWTPTPAPTSPSVSCTDLGLPTEPPLEYFFRGTGYISGFTLTDLLLAAIGIFYVAAMMDQPRVDESLAEIPCGTVSPYIPVPPSVVTHLLPRNANANSRQNPPLPKPTTVHTATDTTTTIEDVSGVSHSAAQVLSTAAAPIAPPSASPPAPDAEETTIEHTSGALTDTTIVQPAENVIQDKSLGNLNGNGNGIGIGNYSMDDYYSATPVIGGYESPGDWSDLSQDSTAASASGSEFHTDSTLRDEQDPEQTLVDDVVVVDTAVPSKPTEKLAVSSNPESASLSTADVKPSPLAALLPAACGWNHLDIDPVSDEEEWERDSECSSSPQEREDTPHSDASVPEVYKASTSASASANSNDEDDLTSAEADWEQVSYKKPFKKLDGIGMPPDENASLSSAADGLIQLASSRDSQVDEEMTESKGKSPEKVIPEGFSKVVVLPPLSSVASIAKQAAKPAPVALWAKFVRPLPAAAPATHKETTVEVVTATSSSPAEEPVAIPEPIDYPDVPITLAGFKAGSMDLADRIKSLLAEPRPVHIPITKPAVASKKSAAKSNTGEIRALLPSGHPVSTIDDWDAPS